MSWISFFCVPTIKSSSTSRLKDFFGSSLMARPRSSSTVIAFAPSPSPPRSSATASPLAAKGPLSSSKGNRFLFHTCPRESFKTPQKLMDKNFFLYITCGLSLLISFRSSRGPSRPWPHTARTTRPQHFPFCVGGSLTFDDLTSLLSNCFGFMVKCIHDDSCDFDSRQINLRLLPVISSQHLAQ